MAENTSLCGPDPAGEIRRLLRMQGVMNASHFMTVPLLALHMTTKLHFGPAALATVMAANLISAQALPLAAGVVADRFGSNKMITLGLLLRGLGFLGFSLSGTVTAWVCFAFVAGTGVACYEGGLYGVLGRQRKESLSAVFAANNLMLNIGTTVGPLIGAIAGLGDTRFAFAASALVFLALGTVALHWKPGSSEQFERRPVLTSLRTTLTHRGLWRLILVALPWFFLFPQLYVAFPLYAGQMAGPHAASAVYVVNGIVGIAFMLAMRRWIVAMNPATMITCAYLAAAIAFASVAILHGVAWFLLFIAVYTVIETTLLPALEAMTAALAVDGSQGTFFGTLSAVGALAGAAGYYAGSWLILNRTALETWATLGSVGILGFVFSAVLLSMPKRRLSPG